jgi:hypothetical protein
MKIFVDTNTFLSFFGLHSSTSSLDEFEDLLNDDSVDLQFIYPEQVRKEYIKNINSRIEEERRKFDKKSFSLDSVPNIIDKESRKDIQEKLQETEEMFNSQKEKFREEYEEMIDRRQEQIDRIFEAGNMISYTREALERAQLRFVKGLPPKKKSQDSHGDAICWELLINRNFTEPFTIISNDSDFTDKVEKNKVLSRYLREEWDEKQNVPINHFRALGEFINNFEDKDVVQKEEIESEYQSSNEIKQLSEFVNINNSALHNLQNELNTMTKSLNTIRSSLNAARNVQERLDTMPSQQDLQDIGTIDRESLKSISDSIEQVRDLGVNKLKAPDISSKPTDFMQNLPETNDVPDLPRGEGLSQVNDLGYTGTELPSELSDNSTNSDQKDDENSDDE